MTLCADSSLIVRLYDPLGNEREAESIHEFLEDDRKIVSITDLCRIEVFNVLLRKPLTGAAEKFLDDLKEGERLRLEIVNWREALQHAESLARRFSATLKPGSHDLVLVASAVTLGADWFLSFDSNSAQRPLAAAAGLKVWPPLDKDEKGLVKHASQRNVG
jgi:predicted nucleic acid-binding protein